MMTRLSLLCKVTVTLPEWASPCLQSTHLIAIFFWHKFSRQVNLQSMQRLAGVLHPGWLSVQPLFILLLAMGLMVHGFVLYTNGLSAVRVARMGTVLYAALVFQNGWIGALRTHVPMEVFFSAIFSVTGLVRAAFLRIAVDRYTPETISSHGVRA